MKIQASYYCISVFVTVLLCGCTPTPVPQPQASDAKLDQLIADINGRQNINRFQIVSASAMVDNETQPVILKIDTATGQTWRFSSGTVELDDKKGTPTPFAIEGWREVSNYSDELNSLQHVATNNVFPRQKGTP